ncbi:unnamed protein product [Peniophora sp. CBMAI 1063]|nr:unnamed protein product [Peniophora sp. CBMAI 1063]
MSDLWQIPGEGVQECPCSKCAPGKVPQLVRTIRNHLKADASRALESTSVSRALKEELLEDDLPGPADSKSDRGSSPTGSDSYRQSPFGADTEGFTDPDRTHTPAPSPARSTSGHPLDETTNFNGADEWPQFLDGDEFIGPGAEHELQHDSGGADDFVGHVTVPPIDLTSIDDEDKDGDRVDLSQDPLFRLNDLDEYLRACAADLDDGDPEGSIPPAFDEHPSIRNAYIHAFVMGAFHGCGQDVVRQHLVAQRGSLLDSLERRPDDPDGQKLREDLAKMAMTMRSVEKRLHVDPDSAIVYYAIFPRCWARYSMLELAELESDECSRTPGCSATLFRTKRTTTYGNKRYPLKILAYHPLRRALRLVLRRPGKREECQAWRGGDDHGLAAPLSPDEWRASLDPSRKLTDIHDGWFWRVLRANARRVWNPDTATVNDVPADGNMDFLRFVSLPCGLVIGIFVDWLQVRKRGAHSSGAVIGCIENLPRSIRFLRENLLLLFTIPGPGEPDWEGMNRILDVMVAEFLELESGELFDVHGHPEPKPVHATCPLTTSDTPARGKTSGYVPPTTEKHMCYVCDKTFSSLTQAHCFDRKTFNYTSAEVLLSAKFRARDAAARGDKETVKEIADNPGVHYAAVDLLPNWHLPFSTPMEPMHCLSGIIADVQKTILVNGGMYNGTGKRNEITPLAKLESWLDNLWVPGTMGRLSLSIAAGTGRPKCDDWRNFATVMPVGVAIAWNMWDRAITEDAPEPTRKKSKAKENQERSERLVRQRRVKARAQDGEADLDDLDLEALEDNHMSKNYHNHYRNVLRMCAGLRQLWTRTTYLDDAEEGQKYLSQAFQSWANMGCHLKPNFHLACHSLEWIECFGTFYAFSAWAFERCMGILSKFKTNNRSGGELECTLMRAWWNTILCQDLIRHMQDMEDKSPGDEAAIEALLSAMRGGAETERQRGTLLNYLASVGQDANTESIKFPKYKAKVDIEALDLYQPLLRYIQDLWPECNIVRYGGLSEGRTVFLPEHVKAYSTIRVNSVKYGASTHPYGTKHCYGYMERRQAVALDWIYRISLSEELTANVAVVRPFMHDDRIPRAPWDMWNVDLGIQMWGIDLGETELQP